MSSDQIVENDLYAFLKSTKSIGNDELKYELPQPPPLMKFPSRGTEEARQQNDEELLNLMCYEQPKNPPVQIQEFPPSYSKFVYRAKMMPLSQEGVPFEMTGIEKPTEETEQKETKKISPKKSQSKASRKQSQISRSRSRSKSHQKDKGFTPCTCSKTNCLKMYCTCFHAGLRCSEECKCEECKNQTVYKADVDRAIEQVIKKAQRNRFSDTQIFKQDRADGCNCRKTKCLKRYCECFIQNKKCSNKCQCEECENGRDHCQQRYVSSRRKSSLTSQQQA